MDTCSQTSRDTVYFPLFPRCTKGPCPVLVHVWHIHTQRRLSFFSVQHYKKDRTFLHLGYLNREGFNNTIIIIIITTITTQILYQGHCVSRTRQMYFSPCSLVFVPRILSYDVSPPSAAEFGFGEQGRWRVGIQWVGSFCCFVIVIVMWGGGCVVWTALERWPLWKRWDGKGWDASRGN